MLLTATSLMFGQVRGPESLDRDTHFALFIPQFKNTTKAKAITDLDKCRAFDRYLIANHCNKVYHPDPKRFA
jgi:hypothetical protein